jgi:cytochrome oxidase Cu insertion factor (SCO1/SenC/PrrC family)
MFGFNSSAPTAPVHHLDSAVHLSVYDIPTPSAQQTSTGRWKMLMVLLVCSAPVVASYLTYYVIRPQGRTNYSELVTPQKPIPLGLPLTDLRGQAVPAASLKGQWLLVVVSGGRCDTECEKMLYLQRQLRETLGREKERLDKVWLITDTALPKPELLQAITPQGAAATVLRVDSSALAQWLQPAANQTPTAHFYIVDPMGNWMMRSPPLSEPAKLKRDLEKLLRASNSWDQAGR